MLSSENREMLERLAMDLKANSKDGWSFVETEGTVTFGFCRWVEEEEWDGDVETVRSLWRPERLTLIERGEAEPDEEELLQWQKAHCRTLADNEDFTSSAFVVPLRVDSNIAGYALFTGNHGLPDVVLVLEGVFESVEAAKLKLASEGAAVEV
jgi:hypothetical protein